MKVYRALLSVHDFFFYVSRELRVGGTEPYISNTALLYAFNRVNTHRNVAGIKPFYDDDRRSFKIYTTPALICEEFMVIADIISRKNPKITSDLVKVTYNSVIEGFITFMEEKKLTLPKRGYYMKYPPLTTFEFFILTGHEVNLPTLIRVGKKYSPARVYYEKLEFSISHGKFRPSHPVNVLDLPGGMAKVLEGRFVLITPVPLLVDCQIEGQYIRANNGKRTYYIAMPDKRLYPSVFKNDE